jgi:hypothetical protein
MRASLNFLILLPLLAATTSRGTILDLKQISIAFTNAITATNQATWSDPEKITVSQTGLGWDGEPASSRDGWIRTKPLALGLSWRPATAVSVRVEIKPSLKEIALANKQTLTPYGGDVYARYSPDLKHWSSWQALQPAQKQPGRNFSGTVRVPNHERTRYNSLISKYSSLDVPWQSDEEAGVKWILAREPDFFAKQIPFIGYIEFLFEGEFHGGQRIESLNVDISYALSGLHAIPKDASIEKQRRNLSWRFEATEKTSPK